MKTYKSLVLICLALFAPSLFGQATNTPAGNRNPVVPRASIPEEARKHFVMGTTLFKDAKTAGDFSQVEGEFKQAADLAPLWPDPRYNLALAKEAAGDFSGAMADLKLYQQFKLSDTEERSVQDKIYALEAKAGAAKKQAETKESEAIERNVQKIVDLQRKFQDLIDKLAGATFVGDFFGSRTEIIFSRDPVNVGENTALKSTRFLWQQELTGRQYHNPGVVIPTGSSTFYETSGNAPTALDIDYSTFDHKGTMFFTANKWTLSQDGQQLTATYDYDASLTKQPYVFYFAKKQ